MFVTQYKKSLSSFTLRRNILVDCLPDLFVKNYTAHVLIRKLIFRIFFTAKLKKSVWPSSSIAGAANGNEAVVKQAVKMVTWYTWS